MGHRPGGRYRPIWPNVPWKAIAPQSPPCRCNCPQGPCQGPLGRLPPTCLPFLISTERTKKCDPRGDGIRSARFGQRDNQNRGHHEIRVQKRAPPPPRGVGTAGWTMVGGRYPLLQGILPPPQRSTLRTKSPMGLGGGSSSSASRGPFSSPSEDSMGLMGVQPERLLRSAIVLAPAVGWGTRLKKNPVGRGPWANDVSAVLRASYSPTHNPGEGGREAPDFGLPNPEKPDWMFVPQPV